MKIYNFSSWLLFVCIIVLYFSITLISNSLILTESFYYSNLSEQFSVERIKSMLDFNNKFIWLTYLVLPIYLLIKFSLLAGIIYIGTFLFNKTLSFSNSFKIVLLGELFFVIAALMKVVYFLIYTPESINEFQSFYPLSLLQFFNSSKVSPYSIYPLQLLNVFEVFYWILLIWGIKNFTGVNLRRAFKIVASSYGIALFMWLLIIVFIQLQFN